MRVRVRVVAAGEVPVEGGDDRVPVARPHVVPLPLSDAGSAGIGKDHPADAGEHLEVSVPLDGRAHLL